MTEYTTIRITKETRDFLCSKGKMEETFDEILQRLIGGNQDVRN